MHGAIFFLLQNLTLQLGLGQRCQPEGKKLGGSSFFAYESDVPLRFSAALCVSFEWLASRVHNPSTNWTGCDGWKANILNSKLCQLQQCIVKMPYLNEMYEKKAIGGLQQRHIAFSRQNDWTSKRHYKALDVIVNQQIIPSVAIFKQFDCKVTLLSIAWL